MRILELYNTYKLSFREKLHLLKDAKEICYNWWVDILDCNKSFSGNHEILITNDCVPEKQVKWVINCSKEKLLPRVYLNIPDDKLYKKDGYDVKYGREGIPY